MKKVTSEEIIYAALSLFSEKGYHATSVDEIARESGMVKASFYKYFKSKEEVLLGTIALIEEQIDKDIEELYLKHQFSPREKLLQFYLIALDRIYKNKIHMLLFSVPLIGSTDEKIARACDNLEQKLSLWMMDFLNDVYGQQLSDYYYDIVFVVKSMIISYVRMGQSELYSSEHRTLAEFIMSITDMLAQGMLKPDSHHKIMWKRNIYEGLEKTWTRGKQVAYILQNMHTIIKQSNLNETDKNEYYQILRRIQRELSERVIEAAHVKALLLFLEQITELQEECKKLKYVLEL